MSECTITREHLRLQAEIRTSLNETPEETDPTGRRANEPGAKLDAGKLMAALLLQFPRALEAMAQVATFGARKYSVGGWLEVPDGINRYAHAEWRHKLARAKGEKLDADSGLLHQAHEVWCVLAQLELRLRRDGEAA